MQLPLPFSALALRDDIIDVSLRDRRMAICRSTRDIMPRRATQRDEYYWPRYDARTPRICKGIIVGQRRNLHGR